MLAPPAEATERSLLSPVSLHPRDSEPSARPAESRLEIFLERRLEPVLSYCLPTNQSAQIVSPASRLEAPLQSSVHVAFALLLAVLMTATGCGSKNADRLAVFPVSGQVIWNGQPLPNAFVVLHPKGTQDLRAITARAQTDQDGNFRVTTYEAGDGVPVGDYAVTVAYHQLITAGGGYEPGPNVLPPKYASPDTTDLTVHVAEGRTSCPRCRCAADLCPFRFVVVQVPESDSIFSTELQGESHAPFPTCRTFRLHTRGTARGDCHHRHFGRPVVAGGPGGSRGGTPQPMREQFASTRNGRP